ncbi:TPA: hypothetical protein U1C34_002098 [Streptococcus suis]|nr:hypothetical protein [Streptococcus suis]HEM3627203.1 hypothetical protein [Streptococcus suis]HEM3653805.1 hypothetical protein [Streptococcus suis]HEM3657435.1 hypothetical protein [Streptococcus suis]HEM3700926.1 hypothetical protein [Streptococcus suis]
MTTLKVLIEQEFHKVKKETNVTHSNPNKPMKQETVSDMRREIASLKEMISYLTPYKRMFETLEETLYGWLLHGKVKIDEIPLDSRRFSHAYTYAWRYAEAKQDVTYGMAILDLFQSDMIELVQSKEIDKETYGEYLKQWMQYLARGLSAFKNSKDYDNYFLKLQEAHTELFREYIGDMENNREGVSLL